MSCRGWMFPFIMFEFSWSNSYIFEDLLFFRLIFLFLLLLDMLYLFWQNLNFFQPDVDLFWEFIAEILIDRCFLIIEYWLEWLALLVWEVILRNLLSYLRILFSLILLWNNLRLLVNVGYCDPTKHGLVFEDTFADILMGGLFCYWLPTAIHWFNGLSYGIWLKVDHRISSYKENN